MLYMNEYVWLRRYYKTNISFLSVEYGRNDQATPVTESKIHHLLVYEQMHSNQEKQLYNQEQQKIFNVCFKLATYFCKIAPHY